MYWSPVVLTLSLSPLSGMRILVTLLLDTLPMLGNVLLLCFFVFFIFGIVGVQLWVGRLRNRCFVEDSFPLWVPCLPRRYFICVFVPACAEFNLFRCRYSRLLCSVHFLLQDYYVCVKVSYSIGRTIIDYFWYSILLLFAVLLFYLMSYRSFYCSKLSDYF